MKLLSVIVAAVIVCHASAVVKSCYNKDGGKVTCTSTENDQACHKPLNSLANNPFTKYGCGPCDYTGIGGKKNENCFECAEENCNTYEVPRKTYKCMKGEAEKECTAPLDSQFCFMAAKGYKGNEEKLKKGGCGSCLMNRFQESETMCMQCRGEKCNDQAKIDAAAKTACQSGAAKMATFLAPILAVLFSILY